ncbi:MAG: sugar ABC transporter ATP-binding protein [Anaerolineales bacterium]|nr:sugar ABC transporter ATP-binding protein [Anaerolineales bacterium]MCS7248378.1 sugar ABC transporter ATP-binding protein [Anaerolineales bacterium]MDW8162191.1 sugar ABC transporter ATP-binding protein [Anaerolineales bacterium]MDW8447200.1 sugar ABC transporter ATP-binding protein [Anaerolineales bacterium]
MKQERRLLLLMEKIDKRFPGVHALDHVDFDLYEGEVHVLLGENGAGKSTLMKILSGSLPRDSGRIFIRNHEMQEIAHMSPEHAQALGIGMVYQELSLVPTLSVAENIFLGRLPRNRFGLIDWKRVHGDAKASLNTLGIDLDTHAITGSLSVAEQQLTEIARVLASQPRILVLDEPTSALSDTERTRLFEIIRRLREKGVGIIYISHRLAEVPLIGDRVTVLRDGQKIGTFPTSEVTEDQLIQMVVGRKLTEQYPKHGVEKGEVLLRVENLSVPGKLENISFEVYAGEILGVFGLMGAGQNELARALFGLEPAYTGRIYIRERLTPIRNSEGAIRVGIGLIPRDRREGLIPMLSIPPNITLGQVSQYSPHRVLSLQKEKQVAQRYIKELRIQPPILDRPVLYLSGGNQQKVVLARWLYGDTQILVLDDPTRGIDVGAKAEVFSIMDSLSRRGIGIVFISSEMQELLAMADRILVLRRGRIASIFQRGEVDQEDLLRSAS